MPFTAWLGIGLLVLLFFAAEAKTSRPDGTLIKVHPYRRMLGVIMPGRNEAVVYFDDVVDVHELERYIEAAHPAFGAHITHCVIAASSIGMAENPAMNRFMSNGRLYARKGRWMSFSMKRQKMNKKAKLAAVKMEVTDDMSFRDFCDKVNERINFQRSGKKTKDDKEFSLLALLPGWVLNVAISFLKWADRHNLLPDVYIRGDGMFTSLFVANLGSLKMGPGYHHLFEWGTCPLFMMVGQVEERVVVRDGKPTVRRVLPLRFSYDERIDDGLTARFGIDAFRRVLENPFEELGCLAEDGSDICLLGPHREKGE
ncbi:MAG: hypothetical protein KC912_13925 [Proteobacteria bacterium]|nr:hypothetical protein [Pseudomonadota bacterium]